MSWGRFWSPGIIARTGQGWTWTPPASPALHLEIQAQMKHQVVHKALHNRPCLKKATPALCLHRLNSVSDGASVLPLFLFIYFLLFRAAPMAHGGSQARGQIRPYSTAIATPDPSHVCDLHHKLIAMLDPQPTEQGQGSNPQPHGS